MVITQIPPIWLDRLELFFRSFQSFFLLLRTNRDDCFRCRTVFSAFNRKHHCRACGETFCSICSSKQSSIHEFGIDTEVRVCISCYDRIKE